MMISKIHGGKSFSVIVAIVEVMSDARRRATREQEKKTSKSTEHWGTRANTQGGPKEAPI
jgi:hypothetical protein